MKRMGLHHHRTVLPILAILASTPVLPAAAAVQLAANAGAAESCAKGLSSDSKLIFDATIKNMKGLDTIREVVEEQTRALVSAGKVGMLAARSAAESAGACLKLLAS